MGNTIEVYGKTVCAKCTSTKRKIENYLARHHAEGIEVVFKDIEMLDGLTDYSFIDSPPIPVVVFRRNGEEVARTEGEIPETLKIRNALEAMLVE